MEIHTCGKASLSPVLLLGGNGFDAEALRKTLPKLEKSYFLLLPDFADGETEEARLTALEDMLEQDFAGRIWGAYGLGEGAALLAWLLERGRVRIRTCVLEGLSALPAELAVAKRARIFLWVAAKDKPSKKALKALRESLSPVSILTMKKLPKDKPLVAVRPDIALKRLLAAFGEATTVTRTAVLDESADAVWRDLCLYPAGDASLLKEMSAIHCEDDAHVQLLEGSSGRLGLWSHMVRLESLGEDGTICTDQVEFDASRFKGLYKALAGVFLKQEQLRRSIRLKRNRDAL